MPTLYDVGPNYLVMELLDSPNIEEWSQAHRKSYATLTSAVAARVGN